jgi:hypothetical protein
LIRWEILPNLTFRPGHGKANPNAPASITYNKDICAKTVKWAIVDWLRDDHRKWIWRVKLFTNVLEMLADSDALPPGRNFLPLQDQ